MQSVPLNRRPHRLQALVLQAWGFGHRIVINAGWSLLAYIATHGLMLLAMLLVAQILGPEQTGRLGLIYSTALVFGSALGAPLGSTATKYCAELLVVDLRRVGRVLALCQMAGLLLAACGAGIGWFSAARVSSGEHSAMSGLLALLAALALATNVIVQLQRGILAGFQAFQMTGHLAVVTGVMTAGLTVGGGFLFGLMGAVGGMAAGSLLLAVLQRVAIHRQLQEREIALEWRAAHREWQTLASFGFPTLIYQNMIAMVNWGCLMLLLRHPNGVLEVGAFTIANQWYAALQLAPASVNTAMLPVMSRVGAQTGARSFKKLLLLGMGINGIAVLPAALILCAVSRPLLASYGAVFVESWRTFVICMITSALVAIVVPIGTLLVSQGRAWFNVFLNLTWCAVVLGGFALLFQFGAIGLASARLIAYVLHGVLAFAAAWLFLSQSNSGAAHDAEQSLGQAA